MKVDVYMKNGRTVFRFAKRGQLLEAIKRNQDKTFEGGSIPALVKHNELDEGFVPTSVQLINPSSIAYVLAVPSQNSASHELVKQSTIAAKVKEVAST